METKKPKDNVLTQQRLKELLHYDPVTGVFTWLGSSGKTKAGRVAGSLNQGYVRIKIDGKSYQAHRLAHLYMTGEWPSDEIDHRDVTSGNNAWENLREATSTQNKANRTSWSKPGFKGVTKNRDRFQARIKVDGKSRYLGTRSTPEEAHALYVTAANAIFGEFTRTA